MLDIFKTHTMLMMVEGLNPLYTFLRDRYFPTNDATDVFATEDVLVEYRDGSKKLAKVALRFYAKAITLNATHRPTSLLSAP